MSNLLPDDPPRPENGYAVDSRMEMTAALWNYVLSSIHQRLAAREALEATFEELIAEGTSAGLTMIQENIAPQLAALRDTIDAALQEISIITEGVAPNSVLLNGQPASYYLDPANFSAAPIIKALLAAADEPAAHDVLGIGDAISAAIDALIAGAPGALDTLAELSAALGDDADFAASVADALASKLPMSGGTMTGKLSVVASAAARAGLRLLPGTSPSVPLGGDIWFTAGKMHVHGAGVTRVLGGTGDLALIGKAEAEAGTSNGMRAWSAERVADAIKAQTDLSLGVAQSWIDVTGERTGNTTYQNTTGRTIVVSAGSNVDDSQNGLQVSHDNSTWLTISAGPWGTETAVVPPGYYYRWSRAGGIGRWSELR